MQKKNHKLIFGAAVVLFLLTLWDNTYMSYLKDLIVFLHESCHALATILTGGSVEAIVLQGHESGFVQARTGFFSLSFVIVVSAGYIGTTFLGSVFLQQGFARKNSQLLLCLLGLVLISLAFLYTEKSSLAFRIATIWACIFFLFSLSGKEIANVAVIFLGTMLCLYSIYDLADFTRNMQATDAGILADYITKLSLFAGKATVLDKKQLAYAIAIFWTLINFRILYAAFTHSFVDSRTESLPAGLDEMKRNVEKGNVTPEIAEWFFKNGLDLDGKPLNGDYMSTKFHGQSQRKENI
ncbi:MAG: M50 family metallopeptidase [Spirochaetota bacterium]